MATSVVQMVNQTISAAGADGSRARAMQRYLQRTRMLPSQARVHGVPQIEDVHAAIWLLANVHCGSQTEVVRAVQSLWILRKRREGDTLRFAICHALTGRGFRPGRGCRYRAYG
jgi:hypothetical protein